MIIRLLTFLSIGIFLSYSAFAQVAFNAGGVNGGAIIVGDSSDACDASMEGALYWDGACFQGCDGTSWECMNGGCDNAPHSFEFTDVTGASTSTVYSSNIVQIDGADAACNSVISVSGDGAPEWRLCSNATCSAVIQAWTTANSSQDTQGNYLQIRTSSAATTNTVNSVTAEVGSTSNIWTVSTTITGSCGATPTIGDVCADGSVYAGITPDGNVPMYVSRCDIGMSWDGSNCTGTRSSLPWNNGNDTGYVDTGMRSYNNGELNTAGLIVLDSDSITAGVQDHQAAQACADLNVHSNTDWYLPSTNEMDVIYENLVDGTPNDNTADPIITGFSTGVYWTSLERYEGFAQKFYFDIKDAYSEDKDNTYYVRCARQN